jgi:short-subunit dehydrogenase
VKILITGASSGLGAELARAYATKENHLILLARRKERLDLLQDELSLHAMKVTTIVVDVTDFEALQNEMRKIDSLDMVLLNAGVSLGHSHQEIATVTEFKNLYDVNVVSNHAILEILLPKFVAQKSGKIVFISSLASLFSMPSSKIYSSSKRALNAYAQGVRYKYAPHGIQVLTLLPGFIKSEMTDKNNFHMPWLLETKEGVAKMVHAIEKNRVFYPFPWQFYATIRLLQLLPSVIQQKIISQIYKQ